MNKTSLKKIFIFLFVFCTIITSATLSLADSIINLPYVIYETSNSQHIGSGVEYENIKKFTSQGWWNINVVRVDLTNQHTEIRGLFNKNGLSKRDTVSHMVTDSQAVAGVNGDFFNFGPIPHPIGTLINDGEIISSPMEKAYAPPTFYLDVNNNAGVAFFDRTMRITSLNNNTSVNISLINKASNMNTVTLLNKNWGPMSFGNKYSNSTDGEMVEMIIVDDIVKDIRINKEAISIPKNGYVIAVRGALKSSILDNFNVGDRVKLDVGTAPNLENIEFAIGCGGYVLKNGEVTVTNIIAAGNHPRTGIGITQDGNELILATIDGRDTSYKGVSQEVFGAIFKELGAYTAVNLDGGGSTTMAIKPVDEQVAKVVNKPSDGGERVVTDGVGVFSNAPKGQLSYIKVNAEDTKMFPDTTRKLSVKGYDQYHNPVALDNSKVEYTVDGVKGEIDEDIFEAESSGTAIVQANYEGLTDTIEIAVLGEVKSIIAPIDRFYLHPNSKKSIGTIYGLDENGFKAEIYNEDIGWDVLGDIGYVKDGVFYSGENKDAGAITLEVGDAIKSILVSVGSIEGKTIVGFESIENFESIVYPDSVVGSIYESPEYKEGQNSIGLKYDFTQGEGTKASYLRFSPEEKYGLAFEGTPNKLSVWVKGDGNGAWLRGIINDAQGNSHYISFTKNINFSDWQKVEANIPSNIPYPISLERIYVVETDSTKKYSGEILIDDLEAYYPPSYDESIAPDSTELVDDRYVEKKESRRDLTLSITRIPENLRNLDEYMTKRVYNEIRDEADDHDLSIFIGKTSEDFNRKIDSEDILNIGAPYISHKYENLFIIDASSRLGGLRPTNAKQWLWLRNGLETTDKDHVILFLNTPVFGQGGFTDKLEADLLHQTLAETYKKGKSVWVIYPGDTTKTELIDGVRYIQLSNKTIKSKEDLKYIDTIKFVIDDKDITYCVD